MKVAIPTTGNRKLTNRVADTFSRAPTFTIITLEDGEIKKVEVIENPGSTIEKGAGPYAARTLKDHQIDVLISGEMGPGARNILEGFDIKIHEAQIGRKVKETIEKWKKLELQLS
ncbi:MAG: dinitrogenase iron-molybdenum cofactor [Candidatus Thorarchaeota archaeon]|jgi:predicted Fe-Mo cluster-binding NifX family protein|nr:MAG: dinitrogenase iron-molybdenum cofactor [Candidatus Thorarchaeota archaeon]